MKASVYKNPLVSFAYPASCKITSSTDEKEAGVVELAHCHGDQRLGRIYVRWHRLEPGQGLAFLANEHRQQLIRLGLRVADSTIMPAPLPDRFDEAAFYQPPTHLHRVDLDAPVVIYRKGDTLASVALVGPGEDVSQIVWKGNQKAFEFIREKLVITADGMATTSGLQSERSI